MKRTPLVRKTPMARGDKPLKRTAIKRVAVPMKRSTWTPKPTVDPIPEAERRAVAARSGGRCEVRATFACGGEAQHVHHRKLRRHGDHRAVNLVHACWACHGTIHNPTSSGLPASWSYDHGWLLRSHDDPAAVTIARG